MKYLTPLLMLLSMAAESGAAVTKTEVIEESVHADNRRFCSKKSAIDANRQCKAWSKTQERFLGSRVLISYCSEGQANLKNPYCSYRSMGQIKFLLKKTKRETTTN